MSEISFCQSAKNDLLRHMSKKKCCVRTFAEASNAFSEPDDEQRNEKLHRVFELLKCSECLKEFLRAAFLHCGNVTDPEREYHLEFASKSEGDIETICEALSRAGMMPGSTVRNEKHVLYFKDSETIEDFLAFIGANRAAFEVMNSKIIKEFRNNTNRAVNCDTANISKTLNASQRCLDAIAKLRERGLLSTLPPELAEAARLREEFPSASITELGRRASPSVTKSGMNHRLEKLLRAAEETSGVESETTE